MIFHAALQQLEVDKMLDELPNKADVEFVQAFPGEAEDPEAEPVPIRKRVRIDWSKKAAEALRQSERPIDPDGERAARAAEQTLTLDKTEKTRRENWLKVPPEVRKSLREQHCNLGHPTNAAFARMLRRQGADVSTIKAVQWLSCDACGNEIRRSTMRPA